MKAAISLLLVFILSYAVNAQTHLLKKSFPALKPLKIKSAENKFFETRVHTGIEAGRIFNVSEKTSGEALNMFWWYLDVNLTERILYFKLEAGGFADLDSHEWIEFASVGFSYRIIRLNRHVIYLFLGVKGWIRGWPGICLVVNPKYVFMVNKWFGISAGFRYMPQISYDQHFLSFSGGVQFFIK